VNTAQISEFLEQGRWPEIISALRQLPPADTARELAALDDKGQQAIFANLPVDLAASLLGYFPYYHQYVLLHKRNVDDMRAILDKMPADERMQLLDELPDEAWERLEEEIGELKRSPSESLSTEALQRPASAGPVLPAISKPLSAPLRELPIADVHAEAIIEARGVEKSFLQADGHNVQIIAPLDLSIYPGTVVALLGASGSGKSTLPQ